jgi:hypothetical protein
MEHSITFSDRAFRPIEPIERTSRGWPPAVLDMAPTGCLRFRPVRGGKTASRECATFPLCQHLPRTETLAHHA